MAKSSPPPAPNYTQAAQQQGQANIDASIVQGQINNPNVVSPYGTQTVSWNGTGNGLYTPTLTQTLSPEQQALYNQQTGNQQQLGMLGATGIKNAQGILGQKVDYSGAPQIPANYNDLRNTVYNASMARPTQDYNVAKDNQNSQLIAAGIRPGTQAYQTASDLLGRQLTDAQQQAQLNAGNQAAQAFGVDLSNRQQGLSELNAQSSIPLNQITALMSGSQVSNPFTMPNYAGAGQVAPAPVYNAAQQQGQYQTDVYNAQQAQKGNTQSGLFGLGGSGIMAGAMMAAPVAASDRRLKSHIVRLGTHPLGIGWYEYDIFGRREQGVMAQELLTVKPDAVGLHPSGYLTVNYDAIGGRHV